MNNLNLIYNKLYYDRLGKEDFDEFVQNKNKEIFATVFDNETDFAKSEIANETFLMKTVYPGLLIGQSVHHSSGKSEGDICVGFDFDFVTGQPYISGSSIKGVLRTCFDYKKEATLEIVRTVTEKELTEEELATLTEEIFGGTDVFFDAVIYDGDEYGRVVGKDYFAPYRGELKQPMPILILKVLPNVRFEFRFILSDGILSANEKSKVFSEIISIFGLGARTNVGYGKMIPCGEKLDPKRKYAEMLQKGKRQVFAVCPHCGTKNYRYKMDPIYKFVTDEENPNWEDGVCINPECGGKLR